MRHLSSKTQKWSPSPLLSVLLLRVNEGARDNDKLEKFNQAKKTLEKTTERVRQSSRGTRTLQQIFAKAEASASEAEAGAFPSSISMTDGRPPIIFWMWDSVEARSSALAGAQILIA